MKYRVQPQRHFWVEQRINQTSLTAVSAHPSWGFRRDHVQRRTLGRQTSGRCEVESGAL